MSPIIFLPLFNNVLKLAEDLNKGYGFRFHLTIPHSAKLPPVGAYVYIKWLTNHPVVTTRLRFPNIVLMAHVK